MCNTTELCLVFESLHQPFIHWVLQGGTWSWLKQFPAIEVTATREEAMCSQCLLFPEAGEGCTGSEQGTWVEYHNIH